MSKPKRPTEGYCLRGGKVARFFSANKVSGVLLPEGFGRMSFRVRKGRRFAYYSILHSDLSLRITDSEAYFYVFDDGVALLDHAPATLGLVTRSTRKAVQKMSKAVVTPAL